MPRKQSPPDSRREPVATALRTMREGAGLTQGELGRRLGHEQSWCARIENCVAGVEPHEIQAWATECGMTAEVSFKGGAGSSLMPVVPELDEEGRALLRRAAVALVLHKPARRRLQFDLEEWERDLSADEMDALLSGAGSSPRAATRR